MNRRIPLVLAIVGILLASTAGMAILMGPLGPANTDGADEELRMGGADWTSGVMREVGTANFTADELLIDSDGDGLPDVIENYVYGSDPFAWSTTGEGIPDGWLARYGHDPTLPGTASRSAATPDPGMLPGAYDGKWPYEWTVKDVYTWGRPADWDEESDGPWDNGIDPRMVSYLPNGIPYSWLYHYGFEPDEVGPELESQRLTQDDFTIRDNFEHKTDPRLADTDADGIPDSEEVERYGSDPTQFSTSRTGISDGWLVSHGLDPSDPHVGSQTTRGKGMSVLDTWEYNIERFGVEGTLRGQGLSPATVSSLDHGIPDGWLVAHGLDPLDPGLPNTVVQRASDWPHVRHLEDAPAGLDPIPDVALTVRDHYEYGRPSDWDEAVDGVWWHGLDPAEPDTDGDGLPDAVEIRGWYIHVKTDIGPRAEGEWRHVRSDPRLVDTDGDGLSDGEEYFGRIVHEDKVIVFPPTDPRNRDTAFSGLSDKEKVLSLGYWEDIEAEDLGGLPGLDDEEAIPSGGLLRPILDPTRRDTGGSFLPDGEELAFWIDYAQRVDTNYQDLYPGSRCQSWEDWATHLPGYSDGMDLKHLLGPLGDIDGDGVPNVVDPDADGDGLLNGWEIRPELYRHSEFSTALPRPVTDPANPDTDCDGSGQTLQGLDDGWTVKHARVRDGSWSISPAKWDSIEPGTSDADGNLNEDIVRYYIMRGGERIEQTFEFTNIMEYERGTDPNVRDDSGDGVTSGWIHFWGRIYPSLDDKGDVVPDPQVIGQLSAARFDNPLGQVGTLVKDLDEHNGEIFYHRVVEIPMGTDPNSFLLDGEDFSTQITDDDGENPGTALVIRDGNAVERTMGVIEGVYQHTYAKDQVHGLNPYLADTSGDGLPDSWKAFYGTCEGLSPSRADAHNVAAGDGLTNMEEYFFGRSPNIPWTHPCMADSDLDGVGDAIEIHTPNMGPMDPFDGVGVAGQDTDRDGIPDEEEIDQGTDPTLPDTSFDGLLDGLHIRWNRGTPNHPIEDWMEQGIAHEFLRVTTSGGQENEEWRPEFDDEVTHVRFFGSRGFSGVDPRRSDSLIDDVPDGWLAYHGRLQGSYSQAEANALKAAYSCNRPNWWDESRMGVWWWGVDPRQQGAQCRTDMDQDGRDDRIGEDPAPAAGMGNHSNDHPAVVAADPTATRLDVLRAAQSWGECAGNPDPCKDEWKGREDPAGLQAPVTIEVDGHPDSIAKLEPFMVTGRLCVEGTDPCTGVPKRTITLQLGDSTDKERSLGVAFTDAQGRFSIEGCICPDHHKEITESGLVVHGRENGVVAWNVPADEIPVGVNDLFLRAYATSPWVDEDHPHHLEINHDGGEYHATGRTTTDALPVDVESETILALQAPSRVDWTDNRNIQVTATLKDIAGGPVAGQSVTVRLERGSTAIEETRETTADGRVSLQMPTPNQDGTFVLHAEFEGTSLLGSAIAQTQSVVLQGPLELSLTLDGSDATVHTGSDVTVTVHATSRNAGAAGVDLRLTLHQTERVATTGSDGTTQVIVPTDGLVAGTYTINVEARGTDAFAQASVAKTIQVVSGSHLTASIPDLVPRGGSFEVTGRLSLPDGSGIGNQGVHVVIGDQHAATIKTDEDGFFDDTVVLPATIGPGLWEATVRYDGEPGAVDGFEVTNQVRVSVPTRISIDEVVTVRGGTAQIEGRLMQAEGQTLRGERVNVSVAGKIIADALTNAQGVFSTKWTVPENATYGAHEIRTAYAGSVNGTYSASQATSRLLVTSATMMVLEPIGNVSREEIALSGRLTTVTGEGISGAPIVFDHDDVPAGEVETGPDGTFNHTLDLTRNAWHGPFLMRAAYEGNETHGPSSAIQSGLLVVQPRLTIHHASEMGRGTDVSVRAMLVDDLQRPLPGHFVVLDVLEDAYEESTDETGVATFFYPLPADTPLGAFQIIVGFSGTEGLLPVTASNSTFVKEGARVEIVSMPGEARAGEPVEVVVRLVDQHANPLEGERLGLRFAGDSTTAVVETGPDGLATAVLPAPMRAGHLVVRYAGNDIYGPAEATSDELVLLAAASSSSMGLRMFAPFGLLLVGLGVTASGLVLWTRIHKRSELMEALESAHARIVAGDDWAAAIQDAYHALVDSVTMHGFEHHHSDSPREFVQVLAETAPIPEDAAVNLVRLFEKATYIEGPRLPADAELATTCLRQIIDSIERFLEDGGSMGVRR